MLRQHTNRWLTVAEKDKIAALTRTGVTQKEIAFRIGCHRNDIYRVQKRLGLAKPRTGWRRPKPSAEEQKQILTRSWRGMGVSRIAAELGLREHAVRRIVEAERKRRGLKPKTWHHLPPCELAKLKREIRERRNYGRALAHKYGVEYKFLLRLVHELLGPYHITPGRTRIPLTSSFPQRWPARLVSAKR